MINWPEYFAAEARIEDACRRAGVAEPRRLAARIHEQSRYGALLTFDLPLDQKARLLARVTRRQHPTNVVVRALRYLQARGEPVPALSAIRLDALLPHDASVGTSKTIYVNPHADYYHTAVRGDILPLAMLIAHEYFHTQHGPDEHAAYTDSLRFLDHHAANRLDLRDDVERRLAEITTQETEHDH